MISTTFCYVANRDYYLGSQHPQCAGVPQPCRAPHLADGVVPEHDAIGHEVVGLHGRDPAAGMMMYGADDSQSSDDKSSNFLCYLIPYFFISFVDHLPPYIDRSSESNASKQWCSATFVACMQ